MAHFPHSPTDDTLVVTPGGSADPHDPDAIQVFSPQHIGAIGKPLPGKDRNTLQIGSAHCSGCGERNTELMIVGPNGKALYVKLRPSMAIKLGELLMIHAKAGSIAQ